MSNVNDGGPAFPAVTHTERDCVVHKRVAGMSLRAYFAGQAMMGLLASGAIGYAAHSRFAAEATKIADALIEELNR